MRFPRALLFVAACAAATPVFPVDWTDPQSVVAAALDQNPTILRLQTGQGAPNGKPEDAGRQGEASRGVTEGADAG